MRRPFSERLPVIGLLIGIAAAAVLGCQARSPGRIAATAPTSAPAEVVDREEDAGLEKKVLELLRKQAANEDDEERRKAMLSSHFPVPKGLAYGLYPEHHVRERIIAMGSPVIAPCMRIATDPKQDKHVVEDAWDVLFQFDDPRIGEALLEYGRTGRPDPLTFCVWVQCYVILDVPGRDATEENAVEWLKEFLSVPKYGHSLGLLDDVMNNPLNWGLLYGNAGLIRWLNRLGAEDVDEVLAQKAPEALAWRNEQLKKGFDPLVAFDFEEAIYDGQLNNAVAKVYSDATDRKRCRELFGTVFSYIRKHDYNGHKGWEDQLRAWYRQNRDHLVYDWAKHRLVVETKAQR
jgi:hypothetical protein